MVIKTWRIYARLDETGEPIEFSCVSCLLHETATFKLWQNVVGTKQDAENAVRRCTYLHSATIKTLKQLMNEVP